MWDPIEIKNNVVFLLIREIEKDPKRFFSGDLDAGKFQVNRVELLNIMEWARGYVEEDMKVDLSPRKRQGS
ncbi:MAG: hypothetical protein UY40_C0005G0006 [candidate division CPR1 bacterium GW2011_GWC1_49_13]|uniref:Uncharacterized protein n=1 Tax=candidate division CPR1 bacterium GW2011_GWC1_49_13 TaxID=1618342 RepID=A0A0G1VHA9_9BACT|nr:MAG: hypothetical protein UY40_C0005G0006 [candidate division CPR1 bacterium GW2011_GWC1_49_13]